ncbi:MAG: HEPN domain-containing protein [Anaerolineae bacterium]
MNEAQLEALLRYRINQAHETLEEARILLDRATVRGGLNRAYYAMFYALLALLATHRLGTSKHGSTIALFDREFVRTGIFSRELSRGLHLAFDRRQKHDYGQVVPVTREMAEETLQDARTFVVAIETHLRAMGHLTDIEQP